MSNKTIGGLDAAVTINDSDLVVVWQTDTSRKTTVASLRKEVENPVIGFADLTGVPDDNSALKAQFDALEAQVAAIPVNPFKILAWGVGNPNAPTSGSANVSIPFPAGYNATTSMIVVSPSYAKAGGTGNGIQTFNYIVTTGTSSWTVSGAITSEGGNNNFGRFQYVVFATGGVTPVNYSAAPVGSEPTPPDPTPNPPVEGPPTQPNL